MKRFQPTIEHIILIITAAATALSISWSWASPLARALRNGTPVNGLIIGTDLVDYARHSDTLIFARYVPDEQFLNIISIPRDTHFSPPGYHFRRINEVFAYHYRTKKSDLAACHEVINAVELLLQNRTVIPFFVQINYASFRNFIDLIGGITIEVDEPMHYDDNAGNLHIHFEPGKQHLDGQQALEYVRYRGKAGDIGRVFRQQRFIKAVLARFKNPVTVLRLPQIVRAVTSDIHTNLSFWDMLAAAMELKDLKPADIRLAQLPGEPRGDYWEIDDQNCSGLFDRIFPSTGTPASQAVVVGPRVRVEVWNASGKHKLADRVNWMLRKQGYDVVEWGTISVNQKKSIIKDLTGNLRPAQRIADILQCGEVITRYDARRLVDISVILGEDCVLPEPQKPHGRKEKNKPREEALPWR